MCFPVDIRCIIYHSFLRHFFAILSPPSSTWNGMYANIAMNAIKILNKFLAAAQGYQCLCVCETLLVLLTLVVTKNKQIKALNKL